MKGEYMTKNNQGQKHPGDDKAINLPPVKDTAEPENHSQDADRHRNIKHPKSEK